MDSVTLIYHISHLVITLVEYPAHADGAVYLHQGRTFLCRKLDLSSRVATVRPADVKYYTKLKDFTDIYVTGKHELGTWWSHFQAPHLGPSLITSVNDPMA